MKRKYQISRDTAKVLLRVFAKTSRINIGHTIFILLGKQKFLGHKEHES